MEEEQKRVHQNTGLTQVLPTAVLTRRLGEKGKKKKNKDYNKTETDPQV